MYVVPSTQGTLPSLAYYPQSFLRSEFNPLTLHWGNIFFYLEKKKIRESLFHPFLS